MDTESKLCNVETSIHLFPVLELAEQVRKTFPACYTAQKNEFILPLWRFHQKVGAKRLPNSL